MANQADKKEVQELLEALNRSCKRRRSRNTLLFKVTIGYSLMVLFATAALIFSAVNLGAITATARDITFAELPVLSTLMKLRSALVAQERFAGRYAILKDHAFVELFRQREREFLANLRVLRRTGSLREHFELERLYLPYQAATQASFSGRRGASEQQRTAAAALFKAINDFHAERQARLPAVIERAERQRRSTIRWTAAISCAGFLLTVWIAPLVTSRLFAATKRLQLATRGALAGEFRYVPEAAYQEIGDLAEDVATLAGRLTELERLNFDPRPSSGNPVAEMVLEEQLQRGEEVAFCSARIAELSFLAASHGYPDATRLIGVTAHLLQAAAREQGCPGYVGYVGGNGFLMLLAPDKVQPVCETAIAAFEAEAERILSQGPGGGGDRDRRRSPAAVIAITALVCGADAPLSAAELARALDRLGEQTAANGGGSRWELARLTAEPAAAGVLTDEYDYSSGKLEEP